MDATEFIESYLSLKRQNEMLTWRVQHLTADLKVKESDNKKFRQALKVYLAVSDENALVPKYSRSKANELALEIMQEGKHGEAEA